MVRGFCFRCRKEIGGFFKPEAWQCLTCRNIYCERCARTTVGVLFKKRVCPECRIEMQDVSHSRGLDYSLGRF